MQFHYLFSIIRVYLLNFLTVKVFSTFLNILKLHRKIDGILNKISFTI